MSQLLFFLAIVPGSALALSTRHDVPDESYVVPDEDYPAVVDLWPGDCTATLIRDDALLTVAHCAEDLRMGWILDIAGEDRAVSRVVLHPDYRGWASDIAVVFVDSPVDHVVPHALYEGVDELGATLTLVGRGLHATGLDGERGGRMDFQLRRAQNVVSRVSEHWLEVVFESPTDPTVLPLEGVGIAGDSGGPAFVETPDGLAIAGLNSWGDAPRPWDIGKYDGWDYSSRVSTYIDWVRGVLAVAPLVEISGGCGDRATLTLSGFSPEGDVAILSASDVGSTLAPLGPCRGERVDLATPLTRRVVLSADAGGAAVLELDLPAESCGTALQAMDLATCLVSPVRAL